VPQTIAGDECYAFRSTEWRMQLAGSHRAAITAQQSCGNNNDRNLIRRDGIGKTMRWKNLLS